MSLFRCRYRRDTSNTWFDSDTALDPAIYVCGGLYAEDVEQPKPDPVPGALDPFRNADPIGTEWQPEGPLPVAGAPKPKPFIVQLAEIMDAFPTAPGFSPVPARDCAWCRVTKKLAPWLGFVVVGLVVAYLSKRLFR